MLQVIINADDLGKNSNVNQAIANAFDCGAITSATILANSNTLDEVRDIIEEYPNASFGVHLNLTEGKSLTENPILYQNKIIDLNSNFTKNVREITNWDSELLEAIFDEWDLQVKSIKKLLRNHISHFDGHHHIHTFYPLIQILNSLCEKYHVNKIRNRYMLPVKGAKAIITSSCKTISRIPYIEKFATKTKSKGNRYSEFVRSAIECNSWRHRTSDLIKSQYFDSYDGGIKNIDFSNLTGNRLLNLCVILDTRGSLMKQIIF